MKKITLFLLTITLLLMYSATAVTGYADTSDTEKEKPPINGSKLTYISSTTTNLEINAIGKACCDSDIYCDPGVDSVRISGYLQRYSNGTWTTVQHWSKDAQGTYTFMYKEYYVTSGYQYRWKVYYYAYSGSNSESITGTDYDAY